MSSSDHLLPQPIVVAAAILLAALTLKLGQGFLSPVLSAFMFGIVLSPLTQLWDRLGLRAALAAFLSMSLALVILIALALVLEPFVSDAIERAPVIWGELRDAARELQAILRDFDQMARDVAAAVDPDTTPSDDAAERSGVEVPSVTDALFLAPQYLGQFMMFVGTLYFFLLTRKQVYMWLGQHLNLGGSDRLHDAERQVARYVLTVTAINAAFGLVIFVVLQALTMPSAAFWGLAAFLANFVLYLGPACVAVALVVSGIVMFDGALSFLPAFVFVALNAIEGQFVTPSLVGRRMAVSPLVVFLSLIFWLWLWGPIGGIIALPILVWVVAVFDPGKDQTISSGIPGRLRPKRRAGRDA